MVTNFWVRNGKIAVTHLRAAHWHSETYWNTATPMHALTVTMIPLHRVEIWRLSVQ